MCVCLLPPSLKVFAPPFRVDSMRPFSWTPRKSHPKWSSCLETFAPSNIMWSLSSDTVNGPLGHLGRENPFPSTAACVLSATGGSREKENCFEQNVHSLWPSLSKPGHVVVQLFQLCIAYCSCMGDLCYATCTFIPLPLTLWLKGKGTVLFFFFFIPKECTYLPCPQSHSNHAAMFYECNFCITRTREKAKATKSD